MNEDENVGCYGYPEPDPECQPSLNKVENALILMNNIIISM